MARKKYAGAYGLGNRKSPQKGGKRRLKILGISIGTSTKRTTRRRKHRVRGN